MTTKPVILCIDDDPDVLDYLEIVLGDADYQVETAESAEEGLRRFEQTAPALVIVDLMMEEVDAGSSFVKELRARRSDVPVFMLSSVGDQLAATVDSTALGLSGILQKPLSKEHLQAVVDAKLKAATG